MLNQAVLFRQSRDSDVIKEIETAKKYLPVLTNRTLCRDQLIIGRYSVLPFYKELEEDLKINGCELINSCAQHRWIADFDYYYEFEGMTPKSWFNDLSLTNYQGPFVVKGTTNSRKHKWNTDFYAKTRQDAVRIACNLRDDPMICQQGIVYREYVPLKTFGVGLCGTRWANEWRVFCYKKNILSYGYYWSSAEPEIVEKQNEIGISPAGLEFAQSCANIASDFTNFYVLDVAETESGKWILIEVNDAQMSGLSENKPETLYKELSLCLTKENMNLKM